MQKIHYVQIRDAQIPCLITEEKIYVAVKSIAEAIGLDARSALRGVKNDEVLSKVRTDQYVPDGKFGGQNVMCLPIEYVNGWLFSIDDKKVKPEIRENLLDYKRECYKVLFDYFYGKSKNIEKNLEQLHSLKKRSAEIDKQIDVLKKEQKQIIRAIENLDKDNFLQLGLKLSFDNERPLLEKGGQNG